MHNLEQIPGNSGDTADNEKNPDFNFTAADVLKTLRTASGKPSIEYIGSGTSHFQAEPLVYGPDGEPLVLSDWEFEVVKNLKGKENAKIKGNLDPAAFPRFLQEKEKYIDRSAELGENMFRFSLDFARLCPKEGEFDTELMADYVKALALIRARGQEPMLTLYHWPMPMFLVKINENEDITKGGWENPEAAKHFRFYVENVIKFLADEDKIRGVLAEENFDKESQDKFLAEGLVKYFLSINEPVNIAGLNYIAGIFPPYKTGKIGLAKKVMQKLIDAHDMTRDRLKSGGMKMTEGREPQVGISHAWNYFDGILGGAFHKIFNKGPASKFERNNEYTDFLALQYYFRMTAPLFAKRGRDYGDNPAFGDIYPPGIYEMLKKMNKEYPQKEIFITEFGFSENKDMRRPYWILETVRYIIEAKKHGIPIKGMLLWSLVNNFEITLPSDQKFGLFDESELNTPLIRGTEGIKSWEVWQSAIGAIANPSEESLKKLQDCYETAQRQYRNAGGKYGSPSLK